MKTSAKTGEGVEDAFLKLARAMLPAECRPTRGDGVDEELLRDLLHALDCAVVERLPNGGYFLHGRMPDWLAGVFDAAPAGAQGTLGGALPFLDHFLPQAQAAWYTGPDGARRFGPVRRAVGGDELLLRARRSRWASGRCWSSSGSPAKPTRGRFSRRRASICSTPSG